MRVLILGGGGMLGHKLWQVLRDRFDAWVTVRSSYAAYARYGLYDPERTLGGVDAANLDSVLQAVATVRPAVVVNAIGVVKQLPAARDPIASLTLNALFPHRLAVLCRGVGARLVHLSTDCVFSGRRGMYSEEDRPDPEDLYGQSKLLGEVTAAGALTLRTSIIGRELATAHGLVEWLLANRGGRVRGYTHAIYSGLPTLVLARVIADLIERHRDLEGLYHVSAEPVSKHDLLCLLCDAYGAAIDIEPWPDVRIDRSLDCSRFRAATGWLPPPWPELVQAMAADPTPYDEWRQTRAP